MSEKTAIEKAEAILLVKAEQQKIKEVANQICYIKVLEDKLVNAKEELDRRNNMPVDDYIKELKSNNFNVIDDRDFWTTDGVDHSDLGFVG